MNRGDVVGPGVGVGCHYDYYYSSIFMTDYFRDFNSLVEQHICDSILMT